MALDGLCEGGFKGGWRDGQGCPGQAKLETADPHRRPHLEWDKPVEEEEENLQLLFLQ